METEGLHYMMTLYTYFFKYVKFCMYFDCLYLLITASNPAVVGYSLYRRTCFPKGIIPLLVLNPYRKTLPSSEWLMWINFPSLLSQVLSAAMNYTRTVSTPKWIHQLLSFHINTLKIGKFSPIVATDCRPVSCQQAFKPAVAEHTL